MLLVTDRVLVNTVTLLDQSSLQNYSSLLVPLVILGSKLVHPAQLGITVLAVDVPHHVPPSQHDPVHHLAEVEVDDLKGDTLELDHTRMFPDLVEEEGSASGSCEPGADQFIPSLEVDSLEF